MNAYPEMYLPKAMINIGDAFDLAIGEMGIPGNDFATMFSYSNVAARLEAGEPTYLIGRSGVDIAKEVIEEKTGKHAEFDSESIFTPTPDYWCGWIVCYYQWLTALSYKEIFSIANYDEILGMYAPLHEADVSKFAEVMEDRHFARSKETKLKKLRTAYGYSQSELARASGVSLRSIQMYEQGNKDINKGQLASIYSLAKALGCRMEDLLEKRLIE